MGERRFVRGRDWFLGCRLGGPPPGARGALRGASSPAKLGSRTRGHGDVLAVAMLVRVRVCARACVLVHPCACTCQGGCCLLEAPAPSRSAPTAGLLSAGRRVREHVCAVEGGAQSLGSGPRGMQATFLRFLTLSPYWLFPPCVGRHGWKPPWDGGLLCKPPSLGPHVPGVGVGTFLPSSCGHDAAFRGLPAAGLHCAMRAGSGGCLRIPLPPQLSFRKNIADLWFLSHAGVWPRRGTWRAWLFGRSGLSA